MMTKIAVPIMVQSLEQGLADCARAAEFGADLVEFRVDGFAEAPPAVVALVERANLPCIVTCRPVWEGGSFEGAEGQRAALLEALTEAVVRPAYVDIELRAYQRSAEMRQAVQRLLQAEPNTIGTGLILSAHDFQRRPSHLFRLLEAMANCEPCRVMKVAWRARSLRDNLEVFEILGQSIKPRIAICMGDFGLPSRVLAGKFGALLTFASLEQATATAPGQPTVAQLKSIYRFDRIASSTHVYGVIGYPVGHSMSPAIHNAGFDATGFDGVYLPMPIPPEYEHFKATVGAWLDAEALDFHGASVTIPHKHHLLRFVNEQGGEIEPLAAAIGAANTLTRRDDGSLYASNSDYAAALDAVCQTMGIERSDLQGKNVAVIGAGGAARAVVAGFSHHGAQVSIYNRTLENAEALAAQFDRAQAPVQGKRLTDLPHAQANVLINCTPMGMHPDVDQTPVDDLAGAVRARGVVFDTIYNPLRTRLLREAEAAGLATIGGEEMFIRQAATQFELWTKIPAPLEVFRQVMTEQLGEV